MVPCTCLHRVQAERDVGKPTPVRGLSSTPPSSLVFATVDRCCFLPPLSPQHKAPSALPRLPRFPSSPCPWLSPLHLTLHASRSFIKAQRGATVGRGPALHCATTHPWGCQTPPVSTEPPVSRTAGPWPPLGSPAAPLAPCCGPALRPPAAHSGWALSYPSTKHHRLWGGPCNQRPQPSVGTDVCDSNMSPNTCLFLLCSHPSDHGAAREAAHCL